LLSCAFFFSGSSKRMAAFFTMNLVIFFSVRSPSYLTVAPIAPVRSQHAYSANDAWNAHDA
jgi:hypothetical protein